MKNLSILLLAIILSVTASAQRVYFIYFETENASPFYVKLDDKLHSSSNAGYYILPNLIDSTYHISIGFPSTNAEVKFRISMGAKDHGFLIKKFDFGWGLFDQQSLNVIKPLEDTWKSGVSYQYRNNDFIALLAKASNDTSLFYIPVELKEDVAVKKSEPVTEELQHAEPVKADTSAAVFAAANTVEEKGPVKTEESLNNSDSALLLTDSSQIRNEPLPVTDSLALLHTSVDTSLVRADSAVDAGLVPAKDSSTLIMVQDTLVVHAQLPTDSAVNDITLVADSILVHPVKLLDSVNASEPYVRSAIKKYAESSTTEGFGLVFHDVYEGGIDTVRLIIPNPKIEFQQADSTGSENGLLEIPRDTAEKKITVVAPKKASTLFPKCLRTATDNDFFKLRKNMAAKETDEDMVYEAKKQFRTKCFTTEQLKNLSTLFLTPSGKYQFFDAAYGHASDPEAFPALGEEIRDDYYLNRFKAMIGN